MANDYAYGDPSGQLGTLPAGGGGYNPYTSSSAQPYNYSSWQNANNTFGGTGPVSSTQGPMVPTAAGMADQMAYGYNKALSQGMLGAAPQMQGYQNAQGIYGGQLGAENVSYGNQQGYLNANYGIGMARNANDVAANMYDQASNQAQLGINAVDIAANARQPGYLTTLQNIANQQYGLTRQGEAANADINRRQLESQLTAQGAFTSTMGNQGRFDIANQLVRQTQGTNLEQQGTTAKYYENMAQVNDQAQRLGYTKQQIQDQGGKLQTMANNLGIDRMQLANTLAQGLDRLGMSHATNVNDLMDKMNSTNIQEAVLAQNTANQAIANSDYYQRMYPGMNAAAGFGGPSTPDEVTQARGAQANYPGVAGGTFR